MRLSEEQRSSCWHQWRDLERKGEGGGIAWRYSARKLHQWFTVLLCTIRVTLVASRTARHFRADSGAITFTAVFPHAALLPRWSGRHFGFSATMETSTWPWRTARWTWYWYWCGCAVSLDCEGNMRAGLDSYDNLIHHIFVFYAMDIHDGLRSKSVLFVGRPLLELSTFSRDETTVLSALVTLQSLKTEESATSLTKT